VAAGLLFQYSMGYLVDSCNFEKKLGLNYDLLTTNLTENFLTLSLPGI
jgi:hypothetical protein